MVTFEYEPFWFLFEFYSCSMVVSAHLIQNCILWFNHQTVQAQERVMMLRNIKASHFTGQDHPKWTFSLLSDSEAGVKGNMTAAAPIGKNRVGKHGCYLYL